MIIDTEEIQVRLFANPIIVARLVGDYALKSKPADAAVLASALLDKLGQTPVSNPLGQEHSNADILRAAVRALGSNSRAWAKFLKHESHLNELLGGYDPKFTRNAFERGELRVEALQRCLPGQTSGADAGAIERWANLLAKTGDYYGFVRDLGEAFRRLAKDRHEVLADTELLLCLVGYLGNPPSAWEGERYLGSAGRSIQPQERKSPGMGYALVSEFLRNLGWSGFKPDRHVKRLFDRWFPNRTHTDAVQKRAGFLARLIGRESKELLAYLVLCHSLIFGYPPSANHGVSLECRYPQPEVFAVTEH